MHDKPKNAPTDLGLTVEEQCAFVGNVARCAAYQLASQETGVPIAELAKSGGALALLGEERWTRLGLLAFNVVSGVQFEATIDANGVAVTLGEMDRLGALVLAQFLANEGR